MPSKKKAQASKAVDHRLENAQAEIVTLREENMRNGKLAARLTRKVSALERYRRVARQTIEILETRCGFLEDMNDGLQAVIRQHASEVITPADRAKDRVTLQDQQEARLEEELRKIDRGDGEANMVDADEEGYEIDGD